MKERIERFLELKSKEINRIAEKYPDEKSLVIDYGELARYDHELAEELITNFDGVINIFENVLTEKIRVSLPETVEEPRFHARFCNLPKERGYTVMIRNITAEYISKFISLEGLVNKISDVLPKVLIGRFYCNKCNEPHDEPQTTRFLREPLQCKNCRKREFRFSPEDSKWTDMQKLEIQEPLEMLKGGEQARRIEIWLEDDLVDLVTAGDKVIVTGLVRLLPPKFKGPVYFKFIEANKIDGIEKEFEDIIITPEEEKQIKKLAKDPNIRSKIVNSIAPSIYGYNEVKEAIALQLFGGRPNKKLPDGTHVRPDIHILLIGDPGVAKSRILQYVNQIAPKSIYVTGKGTTGAGLTATAERDEFAEGAWTLKAGALVLASGGIVAIDEFDKMDKEDRSAMHEAMEQQSFLYSSKIKVNNNDVEIGNFVEDLMKKYPERIIKGKDCFIIPVEDLGFEIFTTDFEKIFTTKINRVSKHIAPKTFVRFKIRNGRELKVTPEHPCWVIRDGKITTIPAEEIKEGEFFPIPERIPFKGEQQDFNLKSAADIPHSKQITLPSHNSPEFCRFIGYHITDGGYELNRGKKNGINFYNKDSSLISDYLNITESLFRIKPYIQKKNGVTGIRLTSTLLMDFLRQLDCLLIEGDEKKRIPPALINCENHEIANLLKALFDGDGTVVKVNRNGIRITLTTPNKELAYQVQELLLRFGIRSSIFSDRRFYKVDITGYENIKRYYEEIGFTSKKKNDRLENYIEIDKTYRSVTNIVPNSTRKIGDILNSLRMNRRFFGIEVYYADNIHKNKLQKIIGVILERMNDLESELENIDSKDVGGLWQITRRFRISQNEIGKELGVSGSLVGYWFRNKKLKSEKIRDALKNIIKNRLKIKQDVSELKRIAFAPVQWTKVTSVEKRGCEDRFVYDITVEPTRAFISNCMVLHNTISIAKAGIVTKFKANTTVLAASNPKFSRFDSYKPLVEQFDIPPTLLSRFDLIFPIRDILDRERDTRIAEHMLKMHTVGEEMKDLEPEIPTELFRKYIAYSRKNIHPLLTNEATEKIKWFYVDLRGMSKEAITATPRQLEALVRLAEASAKMRLSDTVTVSDAERAIELTNFVLRSIAYDQATGEIDIDRIVTEHPRSTRERIRIIEEIIQNLVGSSDEGLAPFDEIISSAQAKNIDKFHAEQILNELKMKGVIYEPRHGWYGFAAR